MKKLTALVFVLMGLLTVGCGSKDGKGAVDGKTGNVTSDNKSGAISFANLSITLPKGWDYEEGETRLRAFSSNEIAIVLVDDFSDTTWETFMKNPEKSMTDFLDEDLKDSEYKILKQGEEDINGLKGYYVYYTYDAGEVGTAACYTYAINSGKGVALLTFDVIESELDNMKSDLSEIKKSIKAQ